MVIIKRFIRLYFQITMILLPVIFLLVFVAVIADRGNLNTSISIQKIQIYTAASSAWCIIMYFFTKWYVRLLYGKHLQNLNDHLKELQNVS